MSRLRKLASLMPWVVLSLGADATVHAEGIHACPDATGEIVYQDDECAPPRAAAKTHTTVAKPPSRTQAIRPGKEPTNAHAAPAKQPRIAAAKRAPSTPTKGIKAVIDPRTFTSDPRWGSPERTLKTFIAAMKDGDRALARSCLTSDALATFGPRVDELSPETLRATVSGYTGFVLEGDLGPFWSIRAIRGKDRPKWIFFERVTDGTWKISAI